MVDENERRIRKKIAEEQESRGNTGIKKLSSNSYGESSTALDIKMKAR